MTRFRCGGATWQGEHVLGQRIAVGRTSVVFEYGDDAVAKVLNVGVPDHWAEVEAGFTTAVRRLGVPAPEVLDVTVITGRPAVIFERVVGPSMWQQMLTSPGDTDVLVDQFASIQKLIHRAGVPDGLPNAVDRVCGKIESAPGVSESDRIAACELMRSFPEGAALLHGDLHPGNVLVGPDGLVVIDWFDAVVGHPVADVARTCLLLRSTGATDLRHLPGAEPGQLDRILQRYQDRMSDVLEPVGDAFEDWQAVIAASRLAEGTDSNTAGLLERWHAVRHRSTDDDAAQ